MTTLRPGLRTHHAAIISGSECVVHHIRIVRSMRQRTWITCIARLRLQIRDPLQSGSSTKGDENDKQGNCKEGRLLRQD
jgi:hypothetical protein